MSAPPPRPEFSRLLRLSMVPPQGERIEVKASETELRALARRFALPAIAALGCVFSLLPEPGGVVRAAGELRAAVTQTCRVSLDELPATVSERFTVRFVPVGFESAGFDPESPDEIAYSGDRIDLGEAAAEQLALALDPWPRKPGASPPA